MNPTIGEIQNARVANFSIYPFAWRPSADVLPPKMPKQCLHTIRKYSDLPCIYVVSKENSRHVAELLSA